MNWKRYGIFSIFVFVLYIVYKAFSLLLQGAISGLGSSLAIMLIDDANEDLSDGAKIYAISEWYRNN